MVEGLTPKPLRYSTAVILVRLKYTLYILKQQSVPFRQLMEDICPVAHCPPPWNTFQLNINHLSVPLKVTI
jgi:hypothetical protein